MKKLKLILLLILLSTSTFAQKVALLVETAPGHPINSDMDIITMKSLLRSDFKVKVISHQEATSTNIRQALMKIAKDLKSNDTFLFYYSGHGDRFSNKTSKEDDNQDDFLVTKDMTCNYNKIDNVMIDDELNYRYAQIKARKIIIIDACHSETLYKSVATSKASKRFKSSSLLKSYETCNNIAGLTRDFSIDPKYQKAKISNMIHLAASLESQQAEGSPEGGIFTLALQKALKEKGNISFGRLIEEIKSNIKPIATRLGGDGLFTPNLNEEGINKRTLYTKDIFVIPKQEAQNNSIGYDSDKILQTVKNSLIKVKNGEAVYERDSVIFDEIQYSWQLLTGLMFASAKKGGVLKVCDFGGSLGSTYYQNKKFLDKLDDVLWGVVEQKHFVDIGKKEFEDDRLKFFYSVDECVEKEKSNVLVLSSVLQYIEKPYELLDDILKNDFEYILIDRTPFSKIGEKITLQIVPPTIYEASYPCRFFEQDKFINYFTKNGYEQFEEFDSLDGENNDYVFKGMILEKKSA